MLRAPPRSGGAAWWGTCAGVWHGFPQVQRISQSRAELTSTRQCATGCWLSWLPSARIARERVARLRALCLVIDQLTTELRSVEAGFTIARTAITGIADVSAAQIVAEAAERLLRSPPAPSAGEKVRLRPHRGGRLPPCGEPPGEPPLPLPFQLVLLPRSPIGQPGQQL